jgi:anti-sigma regulatory factor (Ser/Thr protein kinase)
MEYFTCRSCGIACYSQAGCPLCPKCQQVLSSSDGCSGANVLGTAVRLHGGALAPSQARDMIDGWRGQIDEPALSIVKLLVSELVTNKVALTGCSSVGLALTVDDERIRVTVSEHGHSDVPPDRNGAARSADWGIHLVEGLADRWDVEDGDEPQVWFEIERHRRPVGHLSA